MSKNGPTRQLRSARSYGKQDKDGFIHRSWMKSEGLPDDVFDGRPIIGICNTWSELTPCNAHLRDIAEHVKRGVWEAGGVPLEFPVMSLGETQMRPTAMLFRNLVSMDVEESIRANPIDGVVLLGGCDKTTPAQMMGAASVDLPTIIISSGPMLNGKYKGRDIGSGTDVWRLSEDVRAGELSLEAFFGAEACMSRSAGTCMTMGSASSMACVAEALGTALPYNGTIPAVDARRRAMSHKAGRRIVGLVREDKPFSHFLTRKAFENAVRLHAAIGGSTNTMLHLLALAGRCGIDLKPDDFDALTRGMPLLVNLQPSGRYLMEDFHYAGGVPAVLDILADRLHLDCPSVAGGTLADHIGNAEVYDDAVIHTLDAPVKDNAGLWVLRGNLCEKGAVIKPSAASPDLLKKRGRACVFESIEDLKARIDDPDLDVDADSMLVLKGCGPKGYPGMPEVGNMPIPRKLLERGVKDMIRISDARMSGTAYGTVVLHVAPETAIGGTLALVENDDMIELDAFERRLTLLVEPDELDRRRQRLEAAQEAPGAQYDRGYYRLYIDTVLQADEGCDLEFLKGKSSAHVERESH